MAGWGDYITGMIQNKQLPDGTWLQNVVQEGAILAQDGTILAATPGFTLNEYDYDIQIDEATKKKVHVNEKTIISEVVLNGKSTSSEAGIRINNFKYMLANYDTGKKLAYLSKLKGGACAMATKTVIVYAAYTSSLKMSDGKEQNAGLCNEVVEKVCATLLASGC